MAAGAAGALFAAPVALDRYPMAFAWQVAAASDGGAAGSDGGGNDNGNRDNRNRNDVSQDRGHGRPEADGGGWAYGSDRQDEHIEHANQRYDAALGHADAPGHRPRGDDDRVAHRFSAHETVELIERGWRPRQVGDDGFRNHGERVRTMVELARRLGYDAKVGALQANFGTPYENGIARIETVLEAARADLAAGEDRAAARIAALEARLKTAIAAAKPGNGANRDWARADLDVNGDRVVDRRDLEALGSAPDDRNPSATAPG